MRGAPPGKGKPRGAASPRLPASARRRTLAVTTPRPAPGLPPMASVIGDFDAAGWFCVLAPRDTPGTVIDRLNSAFGAALQLPEVLRVLAQSAFEPVGSSSRGCATRLRRDVDRYGALLRAVASQQRR
ncbi:tripartite tricarboxylate transporter substrate-binding protein [Roseomonas sp. GCM10028921]